MPEPSPDGIDVDARLQQVRSSRMADHVRADPLAPERRHGGTQIRNVPLDKWMP
jgi:hypothetical protein